MPCIALNGIIPPNKTVGPEKRKFRTACFAIGVAFLCAGARAADLRIGVSSEVTTLDPHFLHLTSNTEIHKAIYSGLVTQDADMKVIPDLAVSWRNVDPTHWEFKPRPDVTFHDGAPLTADDVVFTYQRARDVPNSQGSFPRYLKHVTKTTAVDPLTVMVETDGGLPAECDGGGADPRGEMTRTFPFPHLGGKGD